MSRDRLESALRLGPPDEPRYEPVLGRARGDGVVAPRVEPVRRVRRRGRPWLGELGAIAAALAIVLGGVLVATVLPRTPIGPPGPSSRPSVSTNRSLPGEAFRYIVGSWSDRTGYHVAVAVALDRRLYTTNAGFDALIGVNRLGAPSRYPLVAVTLQLADEGAVALDDTLGDHGIDWPDADRITIRMLLSGTSGVAAFGEPIDGLLARIQAEPDRPWGPADALAIAAAGSRRFSPGAGVGLVDTDDALIAEIVARVTGKPATEAVRERVLGPLGLTGFFGYDEPVPPPGSAQDPGRNPGQVERNRARVLGPAGAVTIVEDVDARVLQVLGAARGMSATGPALTRLVEQLHAGTLKLVPPTQLGLFNMAFEDGGFGGRWACPCLGTVPRALVVDGNVGLYASHVAWFPADGVTITVVSNSPVPASDLAALVEEVAGLIER